MSCSHCHFQRGLKLCSFFSFFSVSAWVVITDRSQLLQILLSLAQCSSNSIQGTFNICYLTFYLEKSTLVPFTFPDLHLNFSFTQCSPGLPCCHGDGQASPRPLMWPRGLGHSGRSGQLRGPPHLPRLSPRKPVQATLVSLSTGASPQAHPLRASSRVSPGGALLLFHGHWVPPGALVHMLVLFSCLTSLI